MNLLEKLQQKNHVLNNVVDIIDSFSIRSYNGDELVIYGDNRISKENLGREIFLKTALHDEKNRYKCEKVIGDNDKRFDAMAITDGFHTSLLEFKNINMAEGKHDEESIDILIKQTVIQIQKYLKHIKNNTYFSIIITDCDKIIDDSLSYLNFFEDSDILKSNPYYSLKNNGLAILTFEYIYEFDIINLKSNNTPLHIPVEWISFKALGKKNIPFADKENGEIGIKVINAIDVPTSGTKSVSVRNVREIKDLSEPSKKEIVESILIDLVKAFKKNPNNQYAFFEEGHYKYFQYISNQTMIHEKGDRSIIVTLDGALVDGQNSVNSFKIICCTIKSYLLKEKLTNEQSSLLSKIKIDISDSGLNEFLNFIQNLYIRFSLREIENYEQAVHSAYVKNHSMPVKEEEIIIAKITSPINALSRKLLKEKIYVLFSKKKKFPNINYGVFKHIHARKIINLITRKDSNEKGIRHYLKDATDLNKDISKTTFNRLKNYLNQDGVLEENLSLFEQIEKDIEWQIASKNKIEELLIKNHITKDVFNQETKTINQAIKELNEKRLSLYDLSFKDIESHINEVKKYIYINSIIKNTVSKEDVLLFTKGWKETQGFKKIIIFFDMLYLMLEDKLDLNKCSEDDIKNAINKMVNNFKFIIYSYHFEITSFRNPKESRVISRFDDNYLKTKQVYDIILSDDEKEHPSIELDEENNLDDNKLRQEDLIIKAQEILFNKKKSGVKFISGKDFNDMMYKALESNEIPSLTEKYNNTNKNKQIVRNFVSNDVFGKFNIGKYNSETKMIEIF